jgi:uncharacterized protein (TIGR03067 family)
MTSEHEHDQDGLLPEPYAAETLRLVIRGSSPAESWQRRLLPAGIFSIGLHLFFLPLLMVVTVTFADHLILPAVSEPYTFREELDNDPLNALESYRDYPVEELEELTLPPGSSSLEKQGILVRVQETKTGSSLFGVGVNSDAGISSSIVLDQRNFDIASPAQSHEPDQNTGQTIAEAIRKLGDDSFNVRETAEQTLLKIGVPSARQLRVAMNSPDAGVARRAERILEDLTELHTQQELKLLEGTWELQDFIVDGERMPLPRGDDGQIHRIAIRGRKIVAIREGKEGRAIASLRFHPGTEPNAVDFLFEAFLLYEAFPIAGETGRALYQVSEQRLEFCFARTGEERPTSFEFTSGSRRTIEVLKRVKR